ncbi:hypothetical protein BSKO_04361 [Bryopsis sp. KO-2023]|nr:hypothetical protein BSKO_04361 [Bryopsis sp. KO-2023]
MASSGKKVALLHPDVQDSPRDRFKRILRDEASVAFLLGLVALVCIAGAGWGLQRYYCPKEALVFAEKGDQRELRKMSDLVLPEGYPLEEHEVQTEDGYLLGLYRIPYGRAATPSAQKGSKKPVVLLQHGLLDSSATWVLNGGNRSLAFILADAGFDVWMSNSRGNTFAKGHVLLEPTSTEFWDFTFDQMVKFDLPAVVDTVLGVAGAEKLAYVGHSQGTLIGFLALANDKALAEKVSLAIMMAPVMFVTHMTSPFLKFLAFLKSPELMYALGWKEFMPRGSEAESSLFTKLCESHPDTCKNVMMAISGYNPENLDGSRWDYYMEFTPAGTSAKNLVQWTQGVNNKNQQVCQAFDYGTRCKSLFFWQEQKCNQHMYGSKNPPEYDLTAYDVPTALLWGGKDMLADVTDVELLTEHLPSDILVYSKFLEEYEHLDFTWGIDAHEKIYPDMVKLMQLSE